MRTTFRWIVAAAVGLLATGLSAQDEDIFAEGAFDQAVTTSQASAETTKLSWLGGVSLVSDTTLVLPQTLGDYGLQSLVSGKGFLKADKPDLGQFFVSYAFNHTWASSTNVAAYQSAYKSAEPSLDTPKYQLSELYLSLDVSKVVFVRVGNQLVNWGSSFFWSPADFINQRPSDSQAAVDTRTGKPGVRVHVPFSGGNFFVFGDLSQSLDSTGATQDLTKRGSVAARVDATVAGFNVGLQGNAGQSSKPQVGATFSGRLFGVDLWGEYGATLPVNDYSYAWAGSFGGEKTWDDWTLRGEVFENPDGHSDTKLVPSVLAGYTPLRWGQQYVFGQLAKNKVLGDGLDASLTGLGNLSDASYQVSTSLSVHLPRLVPFSVSVKYNGGPELREFTLATGPNAWSLGLRSVLEF
jgi:hypothetical protein